MNPESTSIEVLHAAQMYLRIAEKNLKEIDDLILRAVRSLAQDAAAPRPRSHRWRTPRASSPNFATATTRRVRRPMTAS